jgi:hypothetical protein
VVFSQDSSLLASASKNGTVRLSQNGSLLASAPDDGTIRLWKPATGQEVQKFENVPGIFTIGLTIDNSTILTNRGALFVDNGSGPGLATLTGDEELGLDDFIKRGGSGISYHRHGR